MPSVSEILRGKAEIKQQRAENNRAERERLSGTRNDALIAVTQMPDLYEKFLVLQADNIGCSAGNVALSMFQLNEPTKIGTSDYWHEQGRYVIDSEMQKGAKVFVPPRNSQQRGYFMGSYYDVTQTAGKPMRETQPLTEGSERMDAAFAALLDACPVPYVENNKLETAARYNDRECVIEINGNKSAIEVFAALATEIVYARDHDRGRNRDFDRTDLQLNAESIGFMVCRRFGVDCPLPDAEKAPAYYGYYEPEDRGKELDALRQTARNMGDTVERGITPRQQDRSNNRMNNRNNNRRQYGGR